MAQTVSYLVQPRHEVTLRSLLHSDGFSFADHQYAFWRGSYEGTTVIFYQSGKVLVQGKNIAPIAELLINQGFLASPEHGHDRWIGVDESGKGDYFGPLVVAAVVIDNQTKEQILKLGCRDCKSLSVKKIFAIASHIKKVCPYAIRAIMPVDYNERIRAAGTLNRLLAQAHADVIEELSEKASCSFAVSDQFGNKSLILNVLKSKNCSIRLEQRHRAEDDIAVAAASVVARDTFIDAMETMGREYEMTFPRGASSQVITAGQLFVQRYGTEQLGNVAKLHFRTTDSVLDLP